MFQYRIFYRGVPGFATDCLCGVGCRGLTTCLLYVGPLFLEIRRARTYLSDATAVPVVTSSGYESFEFSTSNTFLFNSSCNYSLNWRHIEMKLQHPVYYCFVNNILKIRSHTKHEGDILHICDDIISVEIICFRRVNKGLFSLHLLNYSCETWIHIPLLVCKFDILETCFSLFLIPFKHKQLHIYFIR